MKVDVRKVLSMLETEDDCGEDVEDLFYEEEVEERRVKQLKKGKNE